MSAAAFRFRAGCPRMVVYSDLDGTLLDHHSYSWTAARPALERLFELGVPVVPVTSKTIAELWRLRADIGLDGPFAVENGGAIVVPRHYFGANHGQALENAPGPGYCVELLGPAYTSILAQLSRLRSAGYAFTGFSDMGDEQIAAHTGLEPDSAKLARMRLCSEPLLWDGDAESKAAFKRDLKAAGLGYRQGGRFLHVMGHSDKGDALFRLHQRYAVAEGGQGGTPLACALGDSPNDFDMLAAADRGALVQRQDGSYAMPDDPPRLIHAQGAGPEGWRQAVELWLAELNT